MKFHALISPVPLLLGHLEHWRGLAVLTTKLDLRKAVETLLSRGWLLGGFKTHHVLATMTYL